MTATDAETAEGPILVIDPGLMARPGAGQLRDLLGGWLAAHPDHVERAYLRDGPRSATFVVQLAFTGYDDGLERDLSAVALAAARDPELGDFNLDVLAVPKAGEAALPAFVGDLHAQSRSPF